MPGFSLLVCLTVIGSIPQDLFTEKPPTLGAADALFAHFSQTGEYGAGTSELNWIRRERADENDIWSVSKNNYSAAFQFVGISARLGGGELFVAGVDPITEKSIIQRWTWPNRSGRWKHQYTGTANPIGTPTAPYTGTNSIVGGTFAPPPSTWYSPLKQSILSSSAYGFVRGIAADPEGRFVLFSTYPVGDIYRIDLTGPFGSSPPILVTGPAQIPQLATASWLQILDHDDLGRVCVVEPPNMQRSFLDPVPPDVVYLVDGNNDGLFEVHNVVSIDLHRRSFTTMTFTVTSGGLVEAVPSPIPKWRDPWASE